ncbi:MAG: aspartate aminotransferase family protein [Acidobacteriota bacterium]
MSPLPDSEGSADSPSAGDELPLILHPPPGPVSLSLAESMRRYEAPAINTLYYDQPSLVWDRALGSNVWDVDGNRYVDLTAGFGVAAIGHRHPQVVAALTAQSQELIHGLGDVHSHPQRIELARRLADLAPIENAAVYFSISGSDAVEIALKTAVLATGRAHVLAFSPAYHGLTLGALAATSRPRFQAPFQPHLHSLVHRLPFGCPPAEIERLLAAHPIACVLVEPIVGREGVLLPPPGWLTTLADLSRRAGALFIVDEVFTGFGRTGSWFAVDHEELRPDLLCCGKALGGGLPIAAVVGNRGHLQAWPDDGEAIHTATFVANPLACAASIAALDILQEQQLPQRAAALGTIIAERLLPWAEDSTAFPGLTQVRGRGLLWGLEVDHPSRAAAWAQAAMKLGLLLLAGGAEGRVLQIAPPLVIRSAQLHDALDRLARAYPRSLKTSA